MKENINIIEELITELNLDEEIKFEDIPSIDLYMDQVITLFENNLNSSKRDKDDKILTKTMINNYAKDKLLMSIQKKKYTREHIVLMILIYNLKQVLSIADIKFLLSKVVSRSENNEEDINLESIYKAFLRVKGMDKDRFKEDVYSKIASLEDIKDAEGDNYIEILLLALSLINTANMHKRLAEKIIDYYFKK